MRVALTSAVGAALALAAAGVLAPQGASAQAPGNIAVTEVRGPAGEPLIQADEVNDRGQVVAIVDADRSPLTQGDRRVVVWQRGRATVISPAEISARGTDLSNRGQVVGTWNDGVTDFLGAFSWLRGQWTRLTPEPAWGGATAVNDRGQILGPQVTTAPGEPDVSRVTVWNARGEVVDAAPENIVDTGGFNERGEATVRDIRNGWNEQRAAVWRPGRGLTELPSLTGDPSSTYAAAINDAGHVAGSDTNADGEYHAVLWRDGEVTDLGTLGSYFSRSVAINDRDQIIGTSRTAEGDTHAFLWDDGEMIDLGTLGGAGSTPRAINNRGQVVGVSDTADGADHAFLWDDGEMIDLGALVDDDVYSQAHDINDRGQIVGGVGAGSVLWTLPAPERTTTG